MAFPTTSVLDNFTGTDGTALNVYSANWQAAPTSANPLSIQGNAATASVNAAYNAQFWATSYGADTEVYVTVTTPPAAGQPIMTLARCQQETDMATVDGYCLYYVDGSLSVQRIDNGVLTVLGTAVSQTVSAGDAIGLEIVGSRLRGYYKASGGSWAQAVADITDTTYASAGKIGLYSYGNTVRLDDFGGGTVAGGAYTLTCLYGTYTINGQPAFIDHGMNVRGSLGMFDPTMRILGWF